MNDYQPPITPEQVEAAIQGVSTRIGRGVRVCDERYKAFMQADHAYDLAFARAYMAYTGPQHAKKYYAVIETEEERTVRDAAEVAYKHADRLAKALESELRAYQSVGASVRAMFQVAGRGEV